jgi:hypothetical protein
MAGSCEHGSGTWGSGGSGVSGQLVTRLEGLVSLEFEQFLLRLAFGSGAQRIHRL